MTIFNIDLGKVMKLNLPSFLRQRFSIAAIFDAYAVAANSLKSSIIDYRSSVNSRLSYNSQTCYLRKHLNDNYDDAARGISIIDGEEVPFQMLFRRAELLPVLIKDRSEDDPTIINRRDEILYSSAFNVLVPTGLQSREEEIKRSITDYKLSSKNFKITYI